MSLAIEVPLAWLGSRSLVHDAAVVFDGGRVTYAGRRSSHPGADEVLKLDGFLMPGVADRHVHIRFSDPGAVLFGGAVFPGRGYSDRRLHRRCGHFPNGRLRADLGRTYVRAIHGQPSSHAGATYP